MGGLVSPRTGGGVQTIPWARVRSEFRTGSGEEHALVCRRMRNTALHGTEIDPEGGADSLVGKMQHAELREKGALAGFKLLHALGHPRRNVAALRDAMTRLPRSLTDAEAFKDGKKRS